jgi:hypothetical protein
MPYYRHNTESIIYSLTDTPHVAATTYKNKHSGWSISASLMISHAVNPIDPRTRQLSKPEIKAAFSKYETTDSKAQTLQIFFSEWKPKDSTEITAEEYGQLRQAFRRRPPSGRK